jgi:hypothetical protein
MDSGAKQSLVFNRDRKLWELAKDQAQKALTELASRQALTSYSELSRRITATAFEPEGYDFHYLLGELSEESEAEGKGMISVLVVHKEDGYPGKGFFVLAQQLGRDVTDRDRCFAEELGRVFRAYSNMI